MTIFGAQRTMDRICDAAKIAIKDGEDFTSVYGRTGFMMDGVVMACIWDEADNYSIWEEALDYQRKLLKQLCELNSQKEKKLA